MSIDDCYILLQTILNKQQNGNITPAQFNNMAPIAQISIINQELGNEQEYAPGQPIPRYGFGINQKSMENLRDIIQVPQSISFTAGIGTYPTDSLYLFNLNISGKIARPCEEDEGLILSQSQIKAPTTSFPWYYCVGNNIYILPSSIASGTISYVRTPAVPHWNYTVVNNKPVYNPSGSQDFEVGPLLHLKICQRMLQYFGLNLDLTQVTQFAMVAEQQGQ